MHNNVLQFDTEEWKVIDNKIVFINIISEKEVHELIKKYDTEIMKENLRIKKGALETISMVGLIKFQDMIEEEK